MTAQSLHETLQTAVRLLQQGRAQEAESLLETLTRAEPQNADALALLGLAAAHRGDNERAADLMSRAIALNPRHAATHFNYGNVLRKLERWHEAADAYARVLALRADHHEARKSRAFVLHELRRDDEALAELERVPPPSQTVQSLTLHAKLRIAARRPADAVADYDNVIALDPASFEAFNNRGIALDQLERYDDAIKSYDAALALKPNDDNALHNRGASLICLQRYDEALPLFERLIATDPARADNWSCHGVALASVGRLDEALVSFEQALSLDPNSLRARNGRGMALTALARPEEAAEEYRTALALDPTSALTHGNLAFALLIAGDLPGGFAEYEWRRRDGPIGRSQRNYPQPEWQGENLAGRTLLLHPEQGYGDVIHFARFVPILLAKGGEVVLEVPAGLERLCRTLSPRVAVVRSGDPLPPFDAHAPLMSLAQKLKVDIATIPSNVPYLYPDEEKRLAWRRRLAALTGPRVGICWSGSRIHRNDQARSIPLADFARVLEVPGVSFVSLQREVRESDAPVLASLPNVTQVMDEVSDFADTAALIAELDLVVTVDTSVAHVAGAIAKPVWILVSAAPDWRWLLNRNDSPWYPTARLVRQTQVGVWPATLDGVRRALAQQFAV